MNCARRWTRRAQTRKFPPFFIVSKKVFGTFLEIKTKSKSARPLSSQGPVNLSTLAHVKCNGNVNRKINEEASGKPGGLP